MVLSPYYHIYALFYYLLSSLTIISCLLTFSFNMFVGNFSYILTTVLNLF